MIKLSPRSSRPQDDAICKIPAGSGFGGLKARVMIGANVCAGRNLLRRCVTGILFPFSSALVLTVFSPLLNSPKQKQIDSLEIPSTDPLPHVPPVQVLHQLLQARLGFLRAHSFRLDGADGAHGGFLGGGWEGVDVG